MTHPFVDALFGSTPAETASTGSLQLLRLWKELPGAEVGVVMARDPRPLNPETLSGATAEGFRTLPLGWVPVVVTSWGCIVVRLSDDAASMIAKVRELEAALQAEKEQCDKKVKEVAASWRTKLEVSNKEWRERIEVERARSEEQRGSAEIVRARLLRQRDELRAALRGLVEGIPPDPAHLKALIATTD